MPPEVGFVSYRGYVITPHAFVLHVKNGRPISWTIGAFLRTERQSPAQNRYFGQKVSAAKSVEESLVLGIEYGKMLIDGDLVGSVRSTDTASSPVGSIFERITAGLGLRRNASERDR
jgi:hypothetical protein